MKFKDNYANAVNAKSLKPGALAVDVLGAMGWAAKTEPLGAALARVFASGGGATQVLEIMSEEAYRRAKYIRQGMTRVQADRLSEAVLAWYRHGTCQTCGGVGFTRIADTPSLGSRCNRCEGTGRLPFARNFKHEHREVAEWLRDSIERCVANATQTAEKKIA